MSKLVSLLRSTIGAVIIGTLSYFGMTAWLLATTLPKHVAPAHDEHAEPKAEANTTGPSWMFHNPEMDQLIEELKREKEQLAAREKQLKDLESRVQSERAELNEATRAIQKMQAELDRDIVKVKEDEAGNLKRLAKMYSTMEAPGAATILRELDDGVVVKILSFMKEAETAPILDAIAKRGDTDTKRAARLSEMLRLAAANKTAKK